MRTAVGVALALLLSAAALATDDEARPTAPPEPIALIGDPLRTLALPLPEATLDALRMRRWERSYTQVEALSADGLPGAQKGDRAFLLAWALIHGDTPERAVPLFELMDDAPTVPPAYDALVRGEALRAAGDSLDALKWLERVPADAVLYPRAAVQRAEILRELGRTREAFEVYEALVERPDPSAGLPPALLILAEHRGVGSPEAYPLLRRLWEQYPATEEGRKAEAHLKAYSGAQHRPTWQQTARRAERWMYLSSYDRAIAEADSVLAQADDGSVDACRVRYVKGRSYYKKNQLTNAVAGFGDIGERCVEADGGYGPRGLYLIGTAQFRRKQFEASANAYRLLVDEYPEHSMADDALTRGGISLQEAGEFARARAWWEEGLESFPEGDTIKEATFRLAFSLYLEGDTNGARAIAERLGALSEVGDEAHVHAGRYWSARWLAYPDVEDPRHLNPDAAAVDEAIARWRTLCEEEPHGFYAILAYSRLVELAPEVAAELQNLEQADPGRAEAWEVRLGVAEDPSIQTGVQLMRLGLAQEALTEWGEVDLDALSGEEKAWLTELRIAAGDWLLAHDDLRDWLYTHPLGSLGPREPQVVRVAYPDHYWDEVQASVRDSYRYEPRLFHALVREESNFNRQIVSFAGARGLSQLMPATARQTAGWLEMTVTMKDLEDPKINLTIGARYLDAMHKQLSDSPYLALAAYNGGAGNVGKWVTRFDNPPIDELVEQIPFRETRGYVKRVMGTWQTYRWWVDDGPSFPDLSRYNHQARP